MHHLKNQQITKQVIKLILEGENWWLCLLTHFAGVSNKYQLVSHIGDGAKCNVG